MQKHCGCSWWRNLPVANDVSSRLNAGCSRMTEREAYLAAVHYD
jgi:hypothetical protein